MTSVENGANPAANDTADSAVTTQTSDTTQANQDGADQGDTEELDGDGNPIVSDETDELEWDGKKWVLPKDAVATLKPALLRQQDYTQKTQSVAEARKALDAEREAFGTTSKEVIEARVTAHALSKSVKQYDDYFKTPEWASLQVEDPTLAQRHWLQYSQQTKQLSDAEGVVKQKESEQLGNANRERGERATKAFAELPKIIKDWSPELGVKLDNYATAEGLSNKDVLEATIHNPIFVKLLNKARLFDEAAKKQKTQQTFQASQEAKPVTRVGGNGGSANQRRTTDSSGDQLSTEEWAKRERERLSKRKA